MKKKTLLAFTLAAVAAASFAVTGCNKQDDKDGDDTTDPPHTHAYSWVATDPDNHWEECSCGLQKSFGTHVDLVINETQAAGADGKCDKCGRDTVVNNDPTDPTNPTNPTNPTDPSTPSSYLVSFNMKDHGNAPKSQTVTSGGYATTPTAPTAAGYVFIGWCKDADCTVPFNFATDKITGPTVLYANWEPEPEDTTPGASKKYAIALVKGGDGVNLYELSAGSKIYFKYTATVTGRYTLSLPFSPNNNKCRFTTSLDAADVYYGLDNGSYTYEAEKKYFDLAYGETVYVTFDCPVPELLTGTGKVQGVQIDDCTNEPFPSSWVSGEYSGGVITIVLDVEMGKVTYESAQCDVSYVGGSVSAAKFTYNDKTYTLTLGAQKNTLDITYLGVTGTKTVTLELFVEQDPIAVSEFSGTYKPKNNNVKVDNLTEVVIYENGNGSYKRITGNSEKCILGENATFTQRTNELAYDNFVFTLNKVKTVETNADGSTTVTYTNGKEVTLASGADTSAYGVGAVISITVRNTASGGAGAEYLRTGDSGDEVPSKLPLPDNITLTGESSGGTTYKIACSNGTQWWGSVGSGSSIDVTDYVSATGVYTITAYDAANRVTNTYKLTISGEGDETVINLMDRNGVALATLTKPVVSNIPAFVADGETANTFARSKADASGAVYYTVPETGYYTFSSDQSDLIIYHGLSNDNLTFSPGVNELWITEATVVLEGGSVIAVSINECSSSTTSFAFTATKREVPKGITESDPIVIDGTSTTIGSVINDTKYYIEFTAETEGTYKIRCYYEQWSNPIYKLLYTVNGVKNGFEPWWTGAFAGYWYRDGEMLQGEDPIGDFTSDPYATVTLSAGQKVIIVLERLNYDEEDITVTVEKV